MVHLVSGRWLLLRLCPLLILCRAMPLPAQIECQVVSPPSGEWAFGTSDEARDYLRAERFSAGGPIHALSVSLLQMVHDPDLWEPCLEIVQQVHVQILEDMDGMPGRALLDEYQWLPIVPLESVYGDVAQLAGIVVDVNPALGIVDGWLALSGRGIPTCLMLWGSADAGDGISCLDRGQGWEYVDYDLAICAQWQPLAAPQLSLAMTTEGAGLSWAAVPGAARYQVWRSMNGSVFNPLGNPTPNLEFLDFESLIMSQAQYKVTAISP